MDAVFASRLVSVGDLYDYDAIRHLDVATVVVARPRAAALVVGSSQDEGVLDRERCEIDQVRRRRGGGGVVLVAPEDLWIDWWIPAGDHRWRADSRASSRLVGQWWRDALSHRRLADLVVHEGGLEGVIDHRVVCFAGRGPGEVFAGGLKAVGVTQWRVREGVFLSSMVPSRSAREILDCLADVPEGLNIALEHHTTASLGLDASDVARVLAASGDWATGSLQPTL